MKSNEKLLERIRSREKKTELNYGILTADSYVKTLEQCIGSDLCYRYAAKGTTSFADVLKKAASTLTYNNEDMVLEEKLTDYTYLDKDGDELSLPKNTLMVFRHTLTTPRKDRDGDILRSEGGKLDQKMLLLWQHVPTLPIGKMLQVEKQTTDGISVVSAIIDVNELAHDAAVMIDNKMGRFSHGFRALEWEEIKDEFGFDIKSFEVMEESLVSVPSNVDAEVSEILVDLVEAGKLKSGIVREMGKNIRSKRAAHIPVEIDLKLLVNGKEAQGDNKGAAGEDKSCGCGKDKSGASDKTEGVQGEQEEESKAADEEVKEITAEQAMAIFLSKADLILRGRMASALRLIDDQEKRDKKLEQYRRFKSRRREPSRASQ